MRLVGLVAREVPVAREELAVPVALVLREELEVPVRLVVQATAVELVAQEAQVALEGPVEQGEPVLPEVQDAQVPQEALELRVVQVLPVERVQLVAGPATTFCTPMPRHKVDTPLAPPRISTL